MRTIGVVPTTKFLDGRRVVVAVRETGAKAPYATHCTGFMLAGDADNMEHVSGNYVGSEKEAWDDAYERATKKSAS